MTFNINKYKEIKGFIENYSIKNDIVPANIISVTKTHPISTVKEAINSGINHFGENKVQEAYKKFLGLKAINNKLHLHMIGPLQTNKVKKALKIFNYFHSLDRYSLALEFAKYPEIIKTKFFFIQINTGKENQKSGILPDLANEFIHQCKQKLNLNIIGLMCLPPIQDHPKKHFVLLKELALQNNIKELSMGMSADYKIAIENGATFIRIGSSFFGERNVFA